MNSFDMTQFTEAKSDQLNADDLISGPRTITITRVSQGSAEQPVNVSFEGDDGKPFRPCKTMRRVMVAVWGKDAKDYVGKSMTLYRDPKVQFGGMEVGGIRISHMSHLSEPTTMALMATRGKKKPYKVFPLENVSRPAKGTAEDWAQGYVDAVAKAGTSEQLEAFAAQKADKLAELQGKHPGLHERCANALARRRAEFNPPANETVDDDDDWNSEPSSTPAQEWDDSPADTPANDQPDDSTAAEEDIARMIANALGKESWEAARDELARRRGELSAEAAADLDRALAAKKAELTRRG